MKIITKLRIYFFIFKQALKAIPQNNLGDEVIYLGERYILVQGVNYPSWHLSHRWTHERREYIHQDHFQKV